jgi:hypothetical protein
VTRAKPDETYREALLRTYEREFVDRVWHALVADPERIGPLLIAARRQALARAAAKGPEPVVDAPGAPQGPEDVNTLKEVGDTP